MASPEPVEGSGAVPGAFSFRRDPKGGEDSLSLSSCLRFACERVFDLLASPTPKLPRVSGSPVGGPSRIALASLQASFSVRWKG
jgi:hypothetical protein